MVFTPNDVKVLREKTGCGMMDCKKALTHSNGNIEDAVVYLREKGLAAISKKSGRIAAEGMSYSFSDKKGGVIIEVNSETDFVAKNKDFCSFVKTCAEVIISNNAQNVDELLELNINSNEKLGDILRSKILTMGENIVIRRFKKIDGLTGSYVHAGGKIAVLVGFSGDVSNFENESFKEISKNLCMQIAASNPFCIDSKSVGDDVINREKNIIKSQMESTNKPDEVIEKIIVGKMTKFYKEICLLEQPFIKDSSINVFSYLENSSKKLGFDLKVNSFLRYERGEGIEKKKDDFASEVSKIINK